MQIKNVNRLESSPITSNFNNVCIKPIRLTKDGYIIYLVGHPAVCVIKKKSSGSMKLFELKNSFLCPLHSAQYSECCIAFWTCPCFSNGNRKTPIYKTIGLTLKLLLITLTQLLEASTEFVLFSHKFNLKLNIIALADVALSQVRQEANRICPIFSKQFDLTGSCYLCVPSPDRQI